MLPEAAYQGIDFYNLQHIGKRVESAFNATTLVIQSPLISIQDVPTRKHSIIRGNVADFGLHS